MGKTKPTRFGYNSPGKAATISDSGKRIIRSWGFFLKQLRYYVIVILLLSNFVIMNDDKSSKEVQ